MQVALAAVALCVLVGQRTDPFVAQHDAAAARSPLSARFTVAFADDRRTFHPGETIPLVFSYDGLSPTPYNYEHLAHLGLARAVFDRHDGVVYPFDAYDRAGHSSHGGILAGVIGCTLAGPQTPELDGYGNPLPVPPPPPTKCPPVITLTIYLNQDGRFDRPGRYRFYVVDDHVSFLEGRMGEQSFPPLISNVLELEISGGDPEWEARTLAGAIARLDEPNDDKTRLDAARTLAFLGTRGAIDEMILRLATAARDESSIRSTQRFRFVKGLFGARDRQYVIARLERRLKNPTSPLGRLLIGETLASLKR